MARYVVDVETTEWAKDKYPDNTLLVVAESLYSALRMAVRSPGIISASWANGMRIYRTEI